MSVVKRRAEWPAAESAERGPTIVISSQPQLRHEIGSILSRTGMRPAVLIDDPSALVDHEVDESTVIVFSCDVDRPTEVTELRRLCREAPEPAIVVVSPQSTATAVRRTLDAGADALVFEPEIELALVATIRAVESGQSVVPRKLRAGVERPYLSHREHQVLTLVCDGLTNAEVAKALYLAESTIKSHMASIFTKFGVHSRKEATAVFLDLKQAMANPHADPDLPAFSGGTRA